MHTRREFAKLLVSLPLSMGFAQSSRASTIGGIQFGLETFSFHDLPPAGDPRLIPTIVRNMRELGLDELCDRHYRGRLVTLPASDIAREHTGRSLPNTIFTPAAWAFA